MRQKCSKANVTSDRKIASDTEVSRVLWIGSIEALENAQVATTTANGRQWRSQPKNGGNNV